MGDVRMVKCPRCGVPVRYEAANRFRPFCGERCRQIDMGAWASDEYRVAGESVAADDDASSVAEGEDEG